MLIAGVYRAPAQDLESYFGRTISEVKIVIEGASPGTSGEEYRALLLLREGNVYSAAQARGSLLNLLGSGRVANGRIEAQAGAGNTVVITVVVAPQLRVGEVRFRGVDEVRITDLRSRLADLERGAPYSETSMLRGAEQIYEIYRDLGYYQVSIEPQLEADPARATADITYRVTLGPIAAIGVVDFEGQSRIPLDELRAEMRSLAGEPFSRVQLNEDLRRIFDLHLEAGYLAARVGPADVAYNDAENRIIIRIPIHSGGVYTVRVEGVEIKFDKLREVLPMLREGGVEATDLDDGAQRLREYLQEEGYFFAEVEPPAAPDPQAESAELVFRVDPQQRYRIAAILIEGSDYLSYDDVAGDLRSKTESFFPIPLFSRYTRGITSEQSLQRDADLIVARLRDRGFRQARVAAINRAVNPENDKLSIIFEVAEGRRSFIGEIAFAGNALRTADELTALIKLSPGDPAAVTEIRTEGNKILEEYFRRGYALAEVRSRIVELGDDRVRVIYDIREGPLVYVNRTFVNETGTRRRTRSGRINKFLRFAPGELMSNDGLIRTEQDLYALGAFRRVVVRSEALGPEEETGEIRRNVYVDLDEGRSRNLIYGAGYQSDEGARGILEVSDPNIFGRLTTASVRMRVSQRNILGQLSYTDPRPFNFNTPGLAALLLQRENRPAFNSRRATVLLQVERRISDRAIMLYRYNYEDVRVTNPEEVTDRRDAPVRLSRLSTSFAFDGRDNPFDASQGRFHTFDVSVALRGLGGNEQFVRVFTENQYYRTLGASAGTVLAANFRLGIARRFGRPTGEARNELDDALLPITERFFSGGSTTLRGYDFEQAGPRDAGSRPRGGNGLVIINAELRRNVYRQLALVGFYDTGNIFITAGRMRFGDFTHTVGLGLRVKTPLGPIRIDFAYLASSPRTGVFLPPDIASTVRLPRAQVHLSFGQAF
ncbi:MAG: BamA/TamA family outer membrane protein [Acidobacteria bacterium]|nr:BamA/TamA family outer membrane protein [Acidobacteriota bacterium]